MNNFEDSSRVSRVLMTSRASAALVALLLATCGTLTGAPGEARAQGASSAEVVIDRIVARVDDSIITQSEMARMLPIYLQVMGPFDSQALRTVEGQEAIANELIGFLIDGKLLNERAETLGMEFTNSDLDAYLANYQAQLQMTDSQFRQALASEGVDYGDYRNFMRTYLVRMQILRAEAGSEISVSDAEVTEEFNARYPSGLTETYITTAHILIKIPQGSTASVYDEAITELETIRSEIVSGERSFADTAAELNEDSTANSGGQLPAFSTSSLDPDYVRAALSLSPGQISEPVVTNFGVHLVRLDEREERERDDEERVIQRIRYELEQARTRTQQDLYLSRLRADAFVDVLVDDFEF